MSQQVRNGDETKTIAESFSSHIDRRQHALSIVLWNDLYAPTDRIMQDNDPAGSDLFDEPVSHPLRLMIELVFSSHIPHHNEISKPPSIKV
jgi:hypothetical protein